MSLRGFDLLAPHYHWMERVLAGDILQQARLEYLGSVRPRRVLLAGEGHGKFLGPLLDVHPCVEVTCVDASAGMLAAARRRVSGAAGCVRWVHAQLPAWQPDEGGFDLVVTNFFLDCFEGSGLRDVVAVLAGGCADRAAWIVTDFHVPRTSGPARWRALVAVWLMYRFFRLVTRLPARRLEDPAPWISAQGFCLESEKSRNLGLVRSQLWRRAVSPR